MTDDGLTAHGQILEDARGGTSKRQAARDAGISEARWRQIVTGRQRQSGIDVPVNPKRETLIKMANAVGADVNKVLIAAGLEGAELLAIVVTHPDQDHMTFEDFVQSDRTLIPEAKAHLIKQYGLLQRVSEPATTKVTPLRTPRVEDSAPQVAQPSEPRRRAARRRKHGVGSDDDGSGTSDDR